MGLLEFGIHSHLDAVAAVDKDVLDKLADIGSSNAVHSLFIAIESVDVAISPSDSRIILITRSFFSGFMST